jgi:hypothetical protein
MGKHRKVTRPTLKINSFIVVLTLFGSNLVLIFFGGLTYDEAAAALDISSATLHRDLRMAKAWLYNELAQGASQMSGFVDLAIRLLRTRFPLINTYTVQANNIDC